jgi:hypothetical protein
MLPQALQLQSFPISVLLIQPDSDTLGRTKKLMMDQGLDEVAVTILGEILHTATEQPSALFPQPRFLYRNAADDIH